MNTLACYVTPANGEIGMKRLCLLSFLLLGCQHQTNSVGTRHLVILATNDIHGGLEPVSIGGKKLGGLSHWASVVKATRASLENDPASGLLVLDAGDQFQGTLVSNFDEGITVFDVMSAIGYDAVVPGNHAFDFGPVGWLEDKVNSKTTDQNTRGAWDRLVKRAKFRILSANTYLRESLTDSKGRRVTVKGVGCTADGLSIDWRSARRPDFSSPFAVFEMAGVRVAVIGIDHVRTTEMTTPQNVSDLCFRNEIETYTEIRSTIAGKADLFVLLLHNGDSKTDSSTSRWVEKLIRGTRLVDAVIAGHTHAINQIDIEGVPFIQSGAGAERFGRIEIDWDMADRKITRQKSYAGVRLFHDRCDQGAVFCEFRDGLLVYDGVPLTPNGDVDALVLAARNLVEPVAKRRLGHNHKVLTRDRISESPLANVLTDEARRIGQADVALLNTGGLRADIAAGDVLYEDLFRTLPFSNHGIKLGRVGVDTLLEVLRRSIRTCGAYGAIMQSGLRVKFSRQCTGAIGDVDTKAELMKVELLDGTVLFDITQPKRRPTQDSLTVLTFDFLASGGDGYEGLATAEISQHIGILREALVESYLTEPFEWRGAIDGRWSLSR